MMNMMSTAQDVDLLKLSSPRIFLVRMLVFLILCVLLVIVLHKQIWTAFLANPGLNAVIWAVLAVGIALSFRQCCGFIRKSLGLTASVLPIPDWPSIGRRCCWRPWPRSSATASGAWRCRRN